MGLFEGGGTYDTCIYRPVENCRMNSNTPTYCPVCYTSIKTARDGETGHHFRNAHPGRFYGTGLSDLLLHHGTSIQLFEADGTALTHRFSGVERVPGSWQFQPHDQVYVGDFNGDGVDEVAIFNGIDWAIPYLGLLVSDDNGGLRLVARYDGDIPGWGGFARNDHFLVADLNGDGKDDLVVVNADDWAIPYLGMFRSTGTELSYTHRYDGDVPGWDGMARHDRFFAADIDAVGRTDLWVWNHDDWATEYLGAAPAKPTTAANAAAHPTGSGGRQAKAPAETVDEKAGEALAARGHHPDGEHPAQKPRAGDGSGRPIEQCVRLRVRVRGDRLTVLDSHLVDGPLTAPTTLHGAGVYEVTVGDRIVHAAAVPDLGLEQRSFPNLEGPPDQRGHHFTGRATSEFSVRIPAEELTAETIGAVQVRLYRLVEPASGVRVGAQSLGTQLHERVQPVAELAGLPESVLPQAIEARGGRTGQGA